MEQGSLFRLRYFVVCKTTKDRSQWPRGPRRGSAAARLLGFQVRISPGSWMFVPCECYVLSGSLRRADHSSRGVLPCVVSPSVIE